MLKELCLLNGGSGDEKAVREFIINEIKDYCDYRTDNLGNLICEKKGKETPKSKIMIAAHMDEVALIITSVKSDGSLAFSAVGGIEPATIMGKRVTVNGLSGVIGSPAVHNLSASEKDENPKMSSLYIDIGAENKEEAEKYVSLGDMAYFDSEFIELGDGKIRCKAIDDRAGCGMMIDMIKGDIPFDTTFVFTVQEEIGTRGAKTSTFSVNPDIAIVLETTTAADIPLSEGDKKVCIQKKGAVVSFMDRGTIYDRELYKLAFSVANQKGIPVQTKSVVAGGNDSGAIHITGDGVRTMAISIPCRYLHSPSCVADKSDIKACYDLCLAVLSEVGKL
ncbi:MAG: M42 family metallopeptidase [Oscillospiraceae bacterium]|nr:M42 family metallopeptidase [Oscillospiraceae bacterium]